MARYVVGIDLGTTNCALAYAEAGDGNAASASASESASSSGGCGVRHFPIPQVVNPGEFAERATLPSFLHLPADKEFPPGSLDAPWKRKFELPWKKKGERLVGTLAREQGARVAGRTVASAKSWLCHPGVDRRAPILPWAAAEGVSKISPVEASASYLEHLKSAWNHAMAGKSSEDRLENQEILLTVPASFDPAARDLTLEAAKLAGLPKVTLLEEPQAALYAWLERSGEDWRRRVKVGQTLLVCDVGGGTTDFTLITVSERDGNLELTRAAVGDHILLGGDNMDLALAYAVAEELSGGGGMAGLDPIQRAALTHACREAKENLFNHPDRTSEPVAVLGRGAKVIGGGLRGELTRGTLERVILEGFFPDCDPSALPPPPRRGGLSESGLPFAADPAITRQLARFLARQAGLAGDGGDRVRPAAVLFNGGVFQASALRSRLRDQLARWTGADVPELEGDAPEIAVARGAAYYGLARRGRGIRIRGGVSRSFYIGVETAAPAVPGVPPPLKALCVAPMGMEEGTEADVPVPGEPLNLLVGETARFHFLSSTTRRDDPIGALLDRWERDELVELEPIETRLPIERDGGDPPADPGGFGGPEFGETIPVQLRSRVTEIGTLDLFCRAIGSGREWKLEYNVREPGAEA